MKVILLENLKKIGSIGEIIDVKRGYARNFLIANNKALYASKENISQVEKIKSNLAKKDNEKKEEAKKTLEKIDKKIPLHLDRQNKSFFGILDMFSFTPLVFLFNAFRKKVLISIV